MEDIDLRKGFLVGVIVFGFVQIFGRFLVLWFNRILIFQSLDGDIFDDLVLFIEGFYGFEEYIFCLNFGNFYYRQEFRKLINYFQ